MYGVNEAIAEINHRIKFNEGFIIQEFEEVKKEIADINEVSVFVEKVERFLAFYKIRNENIMQYKITKEWFETVKRMEEGD